jgi:hypothetical protein
MEGKVSRDKYTVTSYPVTFLVDSTGAIVDYHLGFELGDETLLEKAVVRMLAECDNAKDRKMIAAAVRYRRMMERAFPSAPRASTAQVAPTTQFADSTDPCALPNCETGSRLSSLSLERVTRAVDEILLQQIS